MHTGGWKKASVRIGLFPVGRCAPVGIAKIQIEPGITSDPTIGAADNGAIVFHITRPVKILLGGTCPHQGLCREIALRLYTS